MRTVLVAAAILATGAGAGAQDRMAMPGPGRGDYGPDQGYDRGRRDGPYHDGQWQDRRSLPGQHWGGQYRGHWIGGMRAPGGWGAYHRPRRGAVLPAYWSSPEFGVADWNGYGLPQPPGGYRWSRYYDDAVLIDGRGAVYDIVGGLDWRRYDLDEAQGGRMDAYNANRDSYDGAGASYDQPGYGPAHGPDGPPPPPGDGPRGGSRFAPPTVVQSGGGTVVTTSTIGGVSTGTYVNGYYYPPAAVTTVTVASAPVVTTTTEVFDDVVTYSRPVFHGPARRAVRRHVWRRPVCGCR